MRRAKKRRDYYSCELIIGKFYVCQFLWSVLSDSEQNMQGCTSNITREKKRAIITIEVNAENRYHFGLIGFEITGSNYKMVVFNALKTASKMCTGAYPRKEE